MAELTRFNVNNDPIGIGYDLGGGSVTQATSKATAVALDAVCGQITMHAANLATVTVVAFTLTNSLIEAHDIVVAQHKSGGTAGAYDVTVRTIAAGSCVIELYNRTGGTLGEAVVVGFMVLKGSIA